MKKATVILGILVIVSLALLVSTISKTMSNNEEKGDIITIHLEDGLTMTDNVEVKKPHPLVGKVVHSADGSTCWKIEELSGVLYYRMMSDCQNA